jgi:hypothetical protein
MSIISYDGSGNRGMRFRSRPNDNTAADRMMTADGRRTVMHPF